MSHYNEHVCVYASCCIRVNCETIQETGLDPPGIKVRASKGLAAVDYFLPGYHVWAYVIEALSDFGYDLNNMVRALRTNDRLVLSYNFTWSPCCKTPPECMAHRAFESAWHTRACMKLKAKKRSIPKGRVGITKP